MSPVKIVSAADPTRDFSSGLGAEVDLVMTWLPHKAVTINLGYSQMFATESMEVLKGGSKSSLNNWAWLQVNFAPQLIKWEISKND